MTSSYASCAFPNRLLGAVTLFVALIAAIIGILAMGLMTIGGMGSNAGPATMSSNWVGYAATGGSFTAVSGTWTVPQCLASSPTGLDATWVGIGGMESYLGDQVLWHR